MCDVYRKGILFGDHFLYRGMLLPTSRDQHDGIHFNGGIKKALTGRA